MDSETYIAKTSVLTPHKISLLVLLSIYFETAIEDDLLETLLFFLIEKTSNEHRFPEPTLQEFCDEIHRKTCPLPKVCTESQRECKSSLEQALLTHLTTLESPHDLIELIKDSKKLTTNEENDPPLGKYSILGIFVRRCYIESEELMFDDISRLYNAFVKYKTDKIAMFSKKGKENMDFCHKPDEFSSILSEVSHRYHMCKQDLIAKCDAESFSHYIITQLRKYGGILPPELESKLRMIHKRMPEISTIYYIDYVNCMQSGEYEGALTNFYKYSNFCPEDVENRNWYQYVLLNLVVLHAKFGHKEQALLAIREAIEMARENNDQECLRFALSWLYRLKSNEPTATKRVDATDQQMLDSLISKAKQSNFIYLQSLGELGNSQRQIQQGASPTEVFESLLRSSILNMNCPFKTMRFQGQLLNASVWQIYGNVALSALNSSEVIGHSDTSPEDLVTAYCQIADLHVSYGNYEQALKLLEESKEKFLGIRRAALQWVVCLEKVLYQRCFARDERASIEALEVQLRGSCQDDEVLQDDFNYNRALYLARIDRPDEAMDLLHELIQKSSRLGSQNQMLVANHYLKLAEIRIETEDPTSALPYVLSSLCISERFHHQSCYFMAKIRLAQILLHFNLAARAKTMIENIMPVILAEHTLRMQSVGYFIYAQCLLGCITLDIKAQREQSILWNDVLIPLRRAQTGFQRLESISELIDVVQVIVYVYNASGDLVQRDSAASYFKKLYLKQQENQRK
ncbi:anaphase-promoting complex subunit 5-domain-containing protein [Gigaspora rosea]|uniref:Anaphase-promoting complex subunit 5 n=1 Tax=Gigaspora rosea TaxID=44941 RepID=A0A397UQA8_9GLOM|nr:anaphase-promoting complex subunit 5-domain-containing protein [Gigaspora rosea]